MGRGVSVTPPWAREIGGHVPAPALGPERVSWEEEGSKPHVLGSEVKFVGEEGGSGSCALRSGWTGCWVWGGGGGGGGGKSTHRTLHLGPLYTP